MYDYHLDDAGISHFDEEEEGKERKVRECFLEHWNKFYKTDVFG